jgi:hypothetical protein
MPESPATNFESAQTTYNRQSTTLDCYQTSHCAIRSHSHFHDTDLFSTPVTRFSCVCWLLASVKKRHTVSDACSGPTTRMCIIATVGGCMWSRVALCRFGPVAPSSRYPRDSDSCSVHRITLDPSRDEDKVCADGSKSLVALM